jgi:hypothetical protein
MMPGPGMKLGDILKNTLKELAIAQLKTATAQCRADLENIRKERKETERWIQEIRISLILQIESSKVPAKKINHYDKQKWLELVEKGNAANQDIWEGFVRFWNAEGLEVIINECHDGVGMESWKSITVKPLPNLSRTVTEDRCGFCGKYVYGGDCDGKCDEKGIGNYSG